MTRGEIVKGLEHLCIYCELCETEEDSLICHSDVETLRAAIDELSARKEC